MGTVPLNFPPEGTMQIGEILTGVSLGNTGPLASTVFFTAPTQGLYDIVALIHVTQTDGAGTLTITLDKPRISPSRTSTGPVTSDVFVSQGMSLFPRGSQARCTVTATGMGATVFNVFVSVVRTF